MSLVPVLCLQEKLIACIINFRNLIIESHSLHQLVVASVQSVKYLNGQKCVFQIVLVHPTSKHVRVDFSTPHNPLCSLCRSDGTVCARIKFEQIPDTLAWSQSKLESNIKLRYFMSCGRIRI